MRQLSSKRAVTLLDGCQRIKELLPCHHALGGEPANLLLIAQLLIDRLRMRQCVMVVRHAFAGKFEVVSENSKLTTLVWSHCSAASRPAINLCVAMTFVISESASLSGGAVGFVKFSTGAGGWS